MMYMGLHSSGRPLKRSRDGQRDDKGEDGDEPSVGFPEPYACGCCVRHLHEPCCAQNECKGCECHPTRAVLLRHKIFHEGCHKCFCMENLWFFRMDNWAKQPAKKAIWKARGKKVLEDEITQREAELAVRHRVRIEQRAGVRAARRAASVTAELEEAGAPQAEQKVAAGVQDEQEEASVIVAGVQEAEQEDDVVVLGVHIAAECNCQCGKNGCNSIPARRM
jgi:hypothetical protein